MRWLNIVLARLRALVRREAVLRDIDEELRLHVEMETEANIARGMAPNEARLAATRSFGNAGKIRDMAYEVRGGGVLETLWQDLRYGARMLCSNNPASPSLPSSRSAWASAPTRRSSASSMLFSCARYRTRRLSAW